VGNSGYICLRHALVGHGTKPVEAVGCSFLDERPCHERSSCSQELLASLSERHNRFFAGSFRHVQAEAFVRHLHASTTRDTRRPDVASVQERVIEIVASQLGANKDQITPETSFINDLGADSLDTVELVMELEEEFKINIPDDAAEKIQTVGQAVEFIEKSQA
jgi:acyl carrier protein